MKSGARMDFCEIFGVRIAAGSREETIEKCASLIGKGGAISTVNPEILYDSLKNNELREALCDSLCIPDGVGVESVIRKRGIFCEKLPGVELGEELLKVKPVKLGIIGGKEGVAERALEQLVMKYGNVIPEFAICGYEIDFEKTKIMLSETDADIVFVCLGSPMQELFIKEMKPFAKKTLFVALGGSVDIYSKEKKRAPKFLRRIKCEWLYRMMSEPKRLKRFPKLIGFTLKSFENRQNRVKICKKTPKTS